MPDAAFITSGFQQLVEFVLGINPVFIYLLLFSMAFLENIIPPIPGDTFSIVGGYMAAIGHLQLVPTFMAITTGCILSIMVIYYLGRRRGRDFFLERDYRFFSAEDVRRVDEWFGRYGISVLLVSRFIVGFRVAIAVAAGLGRVPAGRMFVFSYISGAVFHGLLIGLAFLMYAYVEDIRRGFDIYSKIILVAVAVLVILWLILIFRRYKHGRKKS